jgi:hypothetical protein
VYKRQVHVNCQASCPNAMVCKRKMTKNNFFFMSAVTLKDDLRIKWQM